MFCERKNMTMMTGAFVKIIFVVGILSIIFYIGGYYVVNYSLIRSFVKFDNILKEIKKDVNIVKKEIEEKDLKKEEIKDHICNLNYEKKMINNELDEFGLDFNEMITAAAIRLLVNFFGSRKLDKEKLINFVIDTAESAQDEIFTINEVLYLAKSKIVE